MGTCTGLTMLRVAALAYICLFAVSEADAANIAVKEHNIAYMTVHFIILTGENTQGDFYRFVNTLQAIPPDQAVVVVLSGPGGTLIDALKIGVVIRKNKLKTITYNGCFSACAFIALSGYKKGLAGTGAILGFHGASIYGNITAAGNALIGSYLTRLGYHTEFIVEILKGDHELVSITQANTDVAATYNVHFYPLNNEQQLVSFLMIK